MALRITVDGDEHEVAILALKPALRLEIAGREVAVAGDCKTMVLDGRPVPFRHAVDGDRFFLRVGGRTIETRLVDPRDALADAAGGADEIRAPMPGAVVSVHRRPGDAVRRGEAILTIESMKLQTALTSPRDGILAEVTKSEGDTFEKDAVVARLAETSEGA